MKEADIMEIINRKARYDYQVEEEYEAGIVLTGTEIKSIRLGKVNIKDLNRLYLFINKKVKLISFIIIYTT